MPQFLVGLIKVEPSTEAALVEHGNNTGKTFQAGRGQAAVLSITVQKYRHWEGMS